MTATQEPDLPAPPDRPSGRRRRAGPRDPRRVRVGLAVTAVVCVAFLVVELSAYLGLDPAQSRIPIRADHPLHYPLLWAHIVCGSVALMTACLQMWPWLRRHHPRVHRFSGRVYLLGGVLPGGIAVLGVAPVSSTGFASSVGNTFLAVLWLGTSIAGWRAARQRRYADHRVWMIRSIALTFSIIVNRFWVVLYVVVLSLVDPTDPALIANAATASVWTSWIVTLLVAEWWLLRRRDPRRARTLAPGRAGAPGAT
ncbi:DUF2306 domain-containing protein [Actinomycetospora straminea]|uniref:DUF2306 domain-containing protein n=1 Tax=Actinomycetospora straminea TaxID=663607 RepID=A0ABP9DXI2_9PSEU|nr:DUF2306 domain-containing protein [Actinomycetospora straminea]MDD7934130.1 DUF2306 domain-containing protein [Actinomycetospora straminea]